MMTFLRLVDAEVSKWTSRRTLMGALLILPGLLLWGGFSSLDALGAFNQEMITPENMMEAQRYLLGFAVSVLMVSLSSQIGSTDFEGGLFRYWVMNGHSRLTLLASKYASVIVLASILMSVAIVFGIALGQIWPNLTARPSVEQYADSYQLMMMRAVIYGWLALSLAAVMRSSGAPSSIVLALVFVVFPLEESLRTLSNLAANCLLGPALDSIAGFDDWSLAHSLAVIAAWLLWFVSLACLRTKRGEY